MNLIIKSLNTLINEGLLTVLHKIYKRLLGYFFKILIKRPSSQKWGELKDSFKGETAYLIGNGPSLNETPLYLLKGKNVIVFNRFNLMLERLNWIPTFYSVTDDLVLADMIEEAKYMAKRAKYAFFPDISFRGNVLFKKFKDSPENVLWLHQTPKLGFSRDLPRVYSGGTVIYEGFQILKYLGFRKVVFVGVDMNYQKHRTAKNIALNKNEIVSLKDDDPNHFDPRYFGRGRKYHQPEQKIIDNIFKSLYFLKEHIDSEEFQIVNAGLNSKVDYFKRVNIYETLGYTDDEIQALFTELLHDFNGGDITSFKSINKEDIDKIDSLIKFKANKEIALKLIRSLAGVFIPLGPFNDQYYFIRK